MARIIPTSKQQISVSKLVTKDVTSSKNEHLVIKANKSDDDVHVKVDDLLQVDKIAPLHKTSVEIDFLTVKQINNQDYAGEPINHDHTNLETLENLTSGANFE